MLCVTLARMGISDIPGTLTLAFVGSNPASPAKKINSVSAIGTEFIFLVLLGGNKKIYLKCY